MVSLQKCYIYFVCIWLCISVLADAPVPYFARLWAGTTLNTIPSNMMTSSKGNIIRVTGHLCGEFTGPGEFPKQRPVTRSFGTFFDLRLNKRLSKQSWGWWFETQWRPLWRHCNEHDFVWIFADHMTLFTNKIAIVILTPVSVLDKQLFLLTATSTEGKELLSNCIAHKTLESLLIHAPIKANPR